MTVQNMTQDGKKAARIHYRPDRDEKYPYKSVGACADDAYPIRRWFLDVMVGAYGTLKEAKSACEKRLSQKGYKFTEWEKCEREI